MEKSPIRERQLNMDLLRILACFSVVMLHAAAQFWNYLPVRSAEWVVCNVYDAAFRFGVPLFVMISGRFFLSTPGETNIKQLYGKHIKRLFVVFVLWSVLYGIGDCAVWVNVNGFAWDSLISEVFMGRYHLWYLPMLMGIYMIIPILKKWILHCEKKDIEYLLILFAIFRIGFSTLDIMEFPTYIPHFLGQFKLDLAGGNVGYFVLGYYLYQYPPQKRMQKFIYLSGLLGLIGAILVSTMTSWRKGVPTATAFDSFSVFTFCVVVALYVFFQEAVGKAKLQKSSRLIRELSADTFGIYLLHLGLLEMLTLWGINTRMVNNIVGIPLIAILCFLLCAVVASILRRIPFVGKYIC